MVKEEAVTSVWVNRMGWGEDSNREGDEKYLHSARNFNHFCIQHLV